MVHATGLDPQPTAQSQLNTLNRQKAALEEQIADLEEQLESTFFTPPLPRIHRRSGLRGL